MSGTLVHPKEYTKFGNPRGPSKPLILQWVKKAWDLVTPDIIRKSFKKCGISNAMDGIEDDLLSAEQNDDTFEGFEAAEVEDAAEHHANLQAELVNEIELDPDSDTDVDSVHQDDYEYDPGSPGN